jgi:hypothetical protein
MINSAVSVLTYLIDRSVVNPMKVDDKGGVINPLSRQSMKRSFFLASYRVIRASRSRTVCTYIQ